MTILRGIAVFIVCLLMGLTLWACPAAADTQIFPSKGEARKMWQAGGLGLNKEKISTEKTQIVTSDLLRDKYLLVQKGKKNYYLVKAV